MPFKTVRLNLAVSPTTKEKMLDLAEGERQLGELVNRLVCEEYTRQTVSLESLAERVDILERQVAAMINSEG